MLVVIWAVSGPFFDYSDNWQLVINTSTTIITFLMVFVLQNSQNRDGKALQAKLDELILTSQAQNKFVGIEKLGEAQLREMSKTLAEEAERVKDVADDKAEAREAVQALFPPILNHRLELVGLPPLHCDQIVAGAVAHPDEFIGLDLSGVHVAVLRMLHPQQDEQHRHRTEHVGQQQPFPGKAEGSTQAAPEYDGSENAGQNEPMAGECDSGLR
jgi:low affinity Fe/Cu permease